MQFYSKIRSILSDSNKGKLSKLIIRTGLKPSVNRYSKSPFKNGIIVFSADFEMAWAFRYSKTVSDAERMGIYERENFPKILNLFNENNIPVTWATVGHLFLESCSISENGIKHPEMPRPLYFQNKNWIFNTGDWYDHDPCTNYSNALAWYAPDLVRMIINSDVNHEIGCHTFSHIDFSYENCPNELAVSELDMCINQSKQYGVSIKSMVFPGGTFGNFEILKQKEIICYRKQTRFHIDLPYLDKYGLVVIPSSLILDRDKYGWSQKFHIEILKQFLTKAAKYKQVCHFWFHPSMDKWYLENILPELLSEISNYKNKGLIEIKTMGQLADEFLAIK